MLFRYVRRNLGADTRDAEALAKELGVMPATAEILIGRGIATAEAGRAFFNPGMERLRDPFGLLGMAEAVARIGAAIGSGERITIYGDYDVDGVCATAILMEHLKSRGANCGCYIPSRHAEGYGLNAKAVESLKGTGLLITVDCGVSNAAEAALARELGMDVIVTDHHECPEELPDCLAVVNPKRPGQAYGFSGLCGAGVALKLVQAMGGTQAVERALDLTALATVADIVPLTDENRAIVRMGIERINRAERPGIRALKEAAGLGGKSVKAGSIGFALAPRINAGGRMDLSLKSVELLLTDDADRAGEIARELNDDNAARVKTEEGILEEAVRLIESGYSFSGQRAIVLHRPHWNTGVTGIVASRLAERYHRPAVLFGAGEGACYGSGRSVPGVHLYQALKACSQWFLRFGGHEQAAGCALLEENVGLFAGALDKYLLETYSDDVFLPMRQYDAELPVSGMTMGLAQDMDRLEPCGFGNPRPVFLLKGVELVGLSRTADGKHLRMRFGRQGGIEGIAFRQGDAFGMLEGSAACDALAVPDVNEWMGRQRVQAVVDHIRPPQGFEHAMGLPERAGGAAGEALLRAARCDGDAGRVCGRASREDGLKQLAEAVAGCCWGTLALCFTADSFTAAASALRAAGSADRVYTGIGTASQAARRENALVFAPDAERLPVEGYDRVFVFDGAVAAGLAEQLAARLKQDDNCIIIDETVEDGDPLHFSREELLRVFRAMRPALLEGAGPRSRADWGWVEGVSGWRAEVSARIFVELGLLRETDGHPWLAPVERAAKADLGASAVFRRLQARAAVLSHEQNGHNTMNTSTLRRLV